MYFHFAMPWQPWGHISFVFSFQSVDVNNYSEYRYASRIMRRSMSGVSKHAQKSRFQSRNGLYKYKLILAKKPEIDLFQPDYRPIDF